MFVFDILKLKVVSHLPQIPQSEHLVFTVGDDIATVALRRDVGDTFGMANKDAGRLLFR